MQNIAVIGAGTMGNGIAQACAVSGIRGSCVFKGRIPEAAYSSTREMVMSSL